MKQLARDPELGELRALCSAVELGSLGRAARALQISQPALSKRLRLLEELAGAQLLVRSHAGVTPTPQGRSLYVAARRVLAETDTVVEVLSNLDSENSPARLAVSPTMAESMLPSLLVEFEARHVHHLSVELTIVVSASVWRLVADGWADLGLAALATGEAHADLSWSPFCEDEVVVVVPEQHPWALLDEIPREQFAATELITREPGADSRRLVDQMLAEVGLELTPPVAEIGSNAAAKAAVVSEGVPALLSRLTVGPQDEHLTVRHVKGLRFRRSFVLIHAAQAEMPPVARALLEFMGDRARGQSQHNP